MKVTVENMKLEVIVKSDAIVLCHEKVEKNNSSSKKSKKIQAPIEIGDRNDKNIDDESKENSRSPKRSSKIKVKKIQVPNEDGVQNTKSIDDKSNGESKVKSFFSNLMFCCSKKKTEQTNQKLSLASEKVATSNGKTERSDVPALSLENAVNDLIVEPSKVESENGEVDNSLGESLTKQPKIHSGVASVPFESDEALDHWEVIPLKSSDQINHSFSEPADTMDQGEQSPKKNSNELMMPSLNHSDHEPADTMDHGERSPKKMNELMLSSEDAKNESNPENVTPSNDSSSDNESAENDDGYITNLIFEAQICISNN